MAVTAELPSGGDHGPVVRRAAQAGDLSRVPDTGVGHARDGERLGRVLGDVVSDGIRAERLAGGHDRVAAHGAGIGLRAEGERHRLVAVLNDQADGSNSLTDGIAQKAGHIRQARRPEVIAGSVQPDHGVEVDDAASLVLGHLDEPDADLFIESLLSEPGQPGQMPGQVGDEPAPQVARVGVEQYR